MKQIRIHFCDFGDMQGIANYFIDFLGNHFEVVLDDKTPQYVFYSVFDGSEILKYKDSIRIFYTGENLCADFDLCDYAIDFNHLEFFDRHLRYPLYLFYKEDFLRASKKHQNVTPQILQEKTRFCNFVVSNNIFAESFREEAFYALNSYKRVDSGGRFLNNIGGRVKDKFAFQSECKFSLCFENSSTPGYITEKLIQAAAAKTIPIYWGDERACLTLSERGGGHK
ncbi:glycosyltransferase family 10 domain-containing protein [Helicobacter himalayensis]|uniref:glycosyltransferase family 10 domain-containing protein n=1 Tax=Helicobacter himalayensis TaxID=1591088 RepID=UPI003D701A57